MPDVVANSRRQDGYCSFAPAAAIDPRTLPRFPLAPNILQPAIVAQLERCVAFGKSLVTTAFVARKRRLSRFSVV
jgi:hypothetical protein